MNPKDIDLNPFPNVGNNPFYNKEFAIGNMLPQINLTDNDTICRSIRPYAKDPTYMFELLDKINLETIQESSGDTRKYPVYIMLMHSGTALSSAIKGITHSEFSHSSISFDESMTMMYSFGRKADLNPFIGGFKSENINSDFFQSRDIPYALYVIPCTADQIRLMKQRLDFFVKNQSKFKYDFTGLFKNYFGIVDNPEYKWFCSRFVADIINSGYPNSQPIKNPSLVKPEDFKNMQFAIYVTGGNLKDYNPAKVKQIANKIINSSVTIESTKKRVNDKGEEVPEVCPKCGSKIGVYLRGEPIYLCTNKDCEKYFGTLPCNLTESAEEFITENWLFIQDDFEINLDQWKPGNPLWITGASGDGKSTLTAKLAKDYNAEIVTSDIVLIRLFSTPDKFMKKLNEAKAAHNMSITNSPAMDYVNAHPNLPWGTRDPVTKVTNHEIVNPEMSKFFMWFLQEAKTNPKYKNKLYIIEGSNICLLDPNIMIKQPLIVVGGSRLRSLWRRSKRDAAEKDLFILKSVFKYLRIYNASNRVLDDRKDNFRNSLEDLLNESAADWPKITAKEKSAVNKNDSLSQKAVDITFYNSDNEKVGEASVSSIDTDTPYAYNLEVYSKFRGQHYGHSIMDYLMKKYKVAELSVKPDNEKAINLYKKHGFRVRKSYEWNKEKLLDMVSSYWHESSIAESVKRSELPDSVFGIPEERKYPMPDEKHTRSAMKLFNHCEKKYEEELAKHIIKNIKKYNIDPSFVGPKNRLRKYLIKANLITEGVKVMEDTNPILDRMMYEFFGETTPKSDADILFEKYFGEASKSENIECVPDKIEPMVKKLENKKYRVKYASPGHANTKFDNDKNKDGVINGKLVSTGRIIFERDYHFDGTPDGWEWKTLSNGFKALYVKPFSYNGTDGKENEAFHKWQNDYLSNLNKWIESLPMMDSENPRNKPEEDSEK